MLHLLYLVNANQLGFYRVIILGQTDNLDVGMTGGQPTLSPEPVA